MSWVLRVWVGLSVSRENTVKCLEGSSDIFGSLRKSSGIFGNLRKSSVIIGIVGIKWPKTPWYTKQSNICHLLISHNTPCLPPPPPFKKKFRKRWFSFLLGITAVPREIENNAYAKFWGASKVHFGRCVSDELAFWGPFVFYSGKKITVTVKFLLLVLKCLKFNCFMYRAKQNT